MERILIRKAGIADLRHPLLIFLCSDIKGVPV